MSFLGSIAGPLRKVLAAYASEISVPVLLPCAGNFTVGAALRSGGCRGRITGCDITLYTTALGAYMAGQELQIREKGDCPEHLKGFLDCGSMARLAASVSVMLDLRQVWQNRNAWHRRVLTNYRHDWPELMEKTLARLEAYKAHLAQGEGFDYIAQDASEFLRSSRSPGPIFPADKKLTGDEEPGIMLLNHEQTVRLNELFMSARVDYILSGLVLSVAFCLDRKIIGKADFKLGKGHDCALPEPGPQIYQQSDLAVPSDAEPRLSKLVLMLIQSHEVKSLLIQKIHEDWRYAITTAFSQHPVSMKYRGIYKLHKRLEEDGSEKYRLNYYGELGKWSMKDAYTEWLKKFHKKEQN